MKKTLVISLALLLALSVIGWAQPGPRGQGDCMGNPGMGRHGGPDDGMRMGRGGFGIGMVLAAGDKINLTDEQRDRLEKMKTEFQTQRVDLRANIEKAEINLNALMRDDKAAERDVMTAIDEVSRLKAEAQKAHYRHTQMVKAVLTADQLGKLKELRKDRPMGKGMGPGMGQGMGPGMNPNCPMMNPGDRDSGDDD